MGYATNEALPMTVYYRNTNSLGPGNKMQRPTLQELRKGLENYEPLVGVGVSLHLFWSCFLTPTTNLRDAPKFGWIKGVFFGCLLNIWGVMLYLRLSWVVGQAGIGLATVIIMLSAVVTTVTTLSMSAICTNGEVKGGGAYYLISRSLGPEFGGSIGIIFSIASAVAVAMYVVGFAETVRDLLKENGALIVDEVNDVRIIGLITIVFILAVALVGLKWVVRTQVILLAVLIISILDVIIGTFIGPQNASSKAQGFLGYQDGVFQTNFMPDFRGEGFFSVFAIFFPAATGILAGVNISGDLKNPHTAVPKGTLLAILVSSLVYIVLAWLIGATYARDATGLVMSVAVVNGSSQSNVTSIPTCDTMKCLFGLYFDNQAMQKASGWGPIVTAGIFASTLSSAIASIVGAPKTFQAVCKDKLFPKIDYFGVGYGPGNEPKRGYVLAFLIACAFTAIGDLNAIAPIISNFFLIVYALINYATFVASLGRSPGWRPSFRFYNMWVSLIGALLCVAIMFLINWWAALVTIMIVVGLYKFVDYRKPNVNWGSSGQANTYMSALRFTTLLDTHEEHVKNFRPQCLVLSGRPAERPDLMYIASQLTKNSGLMMYGNVCRQKFDKISDDEEREDAKWLKEHKIKAFRATTTAHSLRTGVQAMLHLTGLGKMKPNTLVLGFKNDWQIAPLADLEGYFGVINDAFQMDFGVAILRIGKETIEFDEVSLTDSICNEDEFKRPEPVAEPLQKPEQELAFEGKQRGTIDVWWLYDDGGLTILLPYLLTLHRLWRSCDLRLFYLDIRSKHAIKADQLKMANLMKKFRIQVSSVVQVPGANTAPSGESLDAFRALPVGRELDDGPIDDKKVLRTIRIGELVRKRSNNAKLVVISLPVPVAEMTTPLMYMSWLEMLSKDLPPVLLVRGNQRSVLTFYS
ncbi:predicted protein [Nematostella vectensis]|uniref:Solute carrier family 12 member 2 n=1 Tax=Nematostella vectensis TaxID=45351 RepID=A7RG55_NEMVE|nr:predicted protein [Nematostella vectensis]|eukprot:XP_001641424.1 predicted protein [Nematostella vectensis]